MSETKVIQEMLRRVAMEMRASAVRCAENDKAFETASRIELIDVPKIVALALEGVGR